MRKGTAAGILALAAIFLNPVSIPCFQDGLPVLLEKRVYDEASPTLGLQNIFFAEAGAEASRFPEGWSDIEEAEIFRSAKIEPVKVVRYRTSGSPGFRYVVNQGGQKRLEDLAALEFRLFPNGLLVADLVASLIPKTGPDPTAMSLPYQILLSEKEGYAYARIAEYREGRITIEGRDYPVQLHHSGPGEFRFDPATSLCLIDRNRDGNLPVRTSLQKDGSLVESERIDLREPFILAGKPWRGGALSPDGSRWELVAAPQRTALAVGFEAPPLAYQDLDGRGDRLEREKSKIVLIQFWSTDCEWTKRIRADLNALIAGQDAASFTALAVAFKSGTTSEVRAFLAQNPMAGRIVTAEEADLSRYNASKISPLFYLIDARGVIRFIGPGAGQVPVLRKMIENLNGVRARG